MLNSAKNQDFIVEGQTDNPTEFSVVYQGEALDQKTMDVKDLAPALLSLGQAFERANSLLNGNSANVNLQIKALSPGSFDILFLLNQTLQGASQSLNGDWMTSAKLLTDLLIGTPAGALGLILLIKKLKGEKPKQTPDNNDCVIFEADHIKLIVPSKVAKMFNDKPIRDQVEGVVRPLLKKGIDEVVFRQNKKELVKVDKSEVEYFTSSDDENDNTKEYVIPRQRLQIESLKFNKQGKWQLTDGEKIRWYSMDDQDFINQIHHGKRFGETDILICEVLMVQQLQPD